ncbi:50S ribosomal protein L25 [Candidatus Falkowbacteria bacterium]|jgi:large subunit ribosomal protein L25|nr:50S ribosomal protein L25 [Candidatus Falkowbacteria bacterium]MBT7007651.1 50S ribosomal protein L25 [Candidatus Falkowbacteria bacterium]
MTNELKAKKREVFGKKTEALRQKGGLPAVVYGPDVKGSLSVELDKNDFEKLFSQLGSSSIISLAIEGEDKPRDVLVKSLDREPVKNFPMHVDFYQIKEGQKLEIKVDVSIIGVSSAVKDLGGTLIQSMDQITVKCLPKEIVSKVELDISALKTFDDKLFVKDVTFPESFEVLHEGDEIIVAVSAPRVEEEQVVAEETPAEGEEGATAEGEDGAAAEGEKKDGEAADGEKKEEPKKE